MCSNFDNAKPAPAPGENVEVYIGQLLAGERGRIDTQRAWPRRDAWIVRADPVTGHWRVEDWRWSLLPFWSKEREPKMSTFNARSETVHRAPSFRGPWRQRRRCLIPLTGWYESAKAMGGKGWVRIRPSTPGITFAGLWDAWTDTSTGEVVSSFTMLTTAAAPSIVQVHNRMPVIIAAKYRQAWLSGETTPDDARRMLHPVEDDFHIRMP